MVISNKESCSRLFYTMHPQPPAPSSYLRGTTSYTPRRQLKATQSPNKCNVIPPPPIFSPQFSTTPPDSIVEQPTLPKSSAKKQQLLSEYQASLTPRHPNYQLRKQAQFPAGTRRREHRQLLGDTSSSLIPLQALNNPKTHKVPPY